MNFVLSIHIRKMNWFSVLGDHDLPSSTCRQLTLKHPWCTCPDDETYSINRCPHHVLDKDYAQTLTEGGFVDTERQLKDRILDAADRSAPRYELWAWYTEGNGEKDWNLCPNKSTGTYPTTGLCGGCQQPFFGGIALKSERVSFNSEGDFILENESKFKLPADLVEQIKADPRHPGDPSKNAKDNIFVYIHREVAQEGEEILKGEDGKVPIYESSAILLLPTEDLRFEFLEKDPNQAFAAGVEIKSPNQGGLVIGSVKTLKVSSRRPRGL
ncbi:hypothetical protein B0H63DRAFT_524917 [Podospora didyma]|uniref:Uncharacterized protein n=1 Tax=Podospora didyma TaxID=330526 RepID=A0AAE0KJZ4_9PEZI|nr:hypothetical protein B0H63DRAFT_524917 [Podospora didyma]